MRGVWVFAVAFGLVSAGAAHAGNGLRPTLDDDVQDAPAPVEYYGNLYSAVTGVQYPAVDSTIRGYSTIGGKFAYDPVDHAIGFQFDGNMSYQPSGSTINWYQATGHVTQAMSNQTKVGLFAGIDKTQTASLGAEMLVTFSSSTWAQAQVALLDPTTGQLGFGIGGSVIQRLGRNFSLRGDLAYNNFPTPGVSAYGGDVAALYTLDTAPVSIGLTGGFNRVSALGINLDEYSLATKVQYSFGGPSEGLRGKLFRTSVLGLEP